MGKISGKFQLEPDGFSIHTFEVTKKLSGKEYRKLVDETYCRCHPGRSTGTRLGRELASGIDASGSSGKGCGSASSRISTIRS